LNQINWEDVVNNPIFAAQIATFLPKDLADSIGISEKDVKTIKLERSPDNGVIIKIAIPNERVDDAVLTIKNPTSKFYTEGSELNKHVDPTYPIFQNIQTGIKHYKFVRLD